MHLYLMIGVSVRIYAIVGEAVYSRGKCGPKRVGQTKDDRGKDVVPQLLEILHLQYFQQVKFNNFTSYILLY